MRRSIALSIICLMPGMLLAQVTPPTTAAAASEPPAKDQKICRREETTGSVISTRVCLTKAEWVAVDAERQRAADQFSASRRNSRGPN